MIYTTEMVKKYIETLNHYKEVVFVEEQECDCMYFDATNPNGVRVSIRADVEQDVDICKWNFYECCDAYDWESVKEIY